MFLPIPTQTSIFQLHLSSKIAFNSDQSKILSSGKELNEAKMAKLEVKKNGVGTREKNDNQHFPSFPECLEKTSFSRSLKLMFMR